VALVDLHMKGLDGISVVRALQTAGSATRLVMLTVSDSSFDVMEALKAGASGYLLKDMEPDEFCLKLRQVAAGARCCRPRSVASRQAPAPSREASTPAGPPHRARAGDPGAGVEGASNKIVARSWASPKAR
jgi:two-component system nitrate/nitrite response regulator NarL